jgi:hypothetical protein
MKKGYRIAIFVTAAALAYTGMARAQSVWPFGGQDETSRLEERLAREGDPTVQALLQGKLDILQNEAAGPEGLDGKAPAEADMAGLCASLPEGMQAAAATPPAGIFPAEGDLLPGSGLRPLNVWQGGWDGQWASVVAAESLEQPGSGALVVRYLNRAGGGVFSAPEGSGVLRIASADGARLTLTNEAGQAYYFDVPAEQWVESADAVVEPLPPQPTFTPPAPICP